ncbi:hypothetical protein HDU77_009400 [Chytriomyces hyalinus]|nr:hypothetical protein HDU77_009400 [Chytriomyces hyalinus]
MNNGATDDDRTGIVRLTTILRHIPGSSFTEEKLNETVANFEQGLYAECNGSREEYAAQAKEKINELQKRLPIPRPQLHLMTMAGMAGGGAGSSNMMGNMNQNTLNNLGLMNNMNNLGMMNNMNMSLLQSIHRKSPPLMPTNPTPMDLMGMNGLNTAALSMNNFNTNAMNNNAAAAMSAFNNAGTGGASLQGNMLEMYNNLNNARAVKGLPPATVEQFKAMILSRA